MAELDSIRACDRAVHFDTETSGIGDRAAIIQASLTDDNGQCLLTAHVRLPAGCSVHPKALAVHGITDEHLSVHGVPWEQVYINLMLALHTAKLNGCRLVIYNAPFDTGMVDQTCRLHSMSPVGFNTLMKDWPPLDGMLAYAEYVGEWNGKYGNYRWHKLTEACERLKLPVLDAHDALGDCRMLGQVVKALKAL